MSPAESGTRPFDGRPLRTYVLPILAVTMAAGIFIIDTFTPLGAASAVFYALVVLLAGRFLPRPGIIIVAIGCLALTVLSYLLQHEDPDGADALLRALASLSAIVITSLLALRNQAVESVLQQQAGLLDLTHDTVFARDLADVIKFWNFGAQELYGWRRAEAVGAVCHALLRTGFPAPLVEINATLNTTGRWEGELVHTRRDGTRVTVASRWSLLRNRDGRAVGILETNNDITDRKEADIALQRAQAELAHVARVATLGEMTASIAHEVNQPLAAIVTNGEVSLRLLDQPAPDVGEVRIAVGDMIGDARRASDVIRRLRTLYQRADPKMVPLEINGTIVEAAALVRHELRSRGVSLRVDLAPALARVSGDAVQLQQVIINLMINGMDAMAAVDDGRRELVVRSRADDSELVVEVTDSGSGIAPGDEERVFDAFFTTKHGGMGMGLSICRTIVERHGGRLWASRNASERGTTFHFTLPLTPGTGT